MAFKIRDLTKKKIEIFFNEYIKTLNITRSCGMAGLSVNHFFLLKDQNEDFALRFKDAQQKGIDLLEERAFARTNDSDTMMIFMLKGNRPEKYGDKSQIDLSGSVTVNMSVKLG